MMRHEDAPPSSRHVERIDVQMKNLHLMVEMSRFVPDGDLEKSAETIISLQ